MSKQTRMEAFIQTIENEYGLDNNEGIRLAVTGLSRADVNEMAVRWVMHCISKRTRTETRTVERTAIAPADAPIKWESITARKQKAAFEKKCAEQEASYLKQQDDAWNAIQSAFDELKDRWRVDWTAELLDAQFNMPDGTTVTWGTATLEQHEARVEMFRVNAVANLEGAARHQQAIEDIKRAGVSTLHHLVGVAA